MESKVCAIFERAIHDETLREGQSRSKNASNPFAVLSDQDRNELHLSYIDFLCDYSSDVKLLRDVEYEFRTHKIAVRSLKKRAREREDDEREAIKKRRLEVQQAQQAQQQPTIQYTGSGPRPLHYHFGYEGVQ